MKKIFTKAAWTEWKNKFVGYWERNGFAAVLLFCAGIVGVTAIVTSGVQPTTEQVAESTPIPTMRALQVEPDLLVVAATQTPTPLPLVLPVQGTVGMAYLPEELVYSKTLAQWSTHDGVDILAPEGLNVVASAAGVVSSAMIDPTWGNVVIILHENGIMTGYASLGTMIVKEGDAVSQGQCIGTVGNTADIESEEGSHIHFYVVKDSQIVDPNDFLR